MKNQLFSSSKDPVVSILMNCLNCSKYLSDAIDSVYSQTYDDWEIVFWDNASTDNSAKIAKEYDKLCYFRGEKTVPLGHARNLAIEKAKGKYIAFLDCDDIWLPEKLEKQVKLLESNQKLGLVYSDNYVIDSNGFFLKKKSILPFTMFRGNIFNELFYQNFIPFLTVVIRKEVLNKVGMFNPKYEIAEEYDLFLRIAEYYHVDFVDRSLAKYRVHDGNCSKDIKLTVVEDLQIMNFWLDKKPELKRELRGKILLKKARLFYNIFRDRYLQR